ncbi:MAG TPA: MarR family winged helix-turn-helix transcriptional regulator [Pseudonocardiaceae bacterium]|nr:MarR family winged helix-turn-helix transcriptional regulator [Pseudonocardiaceae bacterium]
MTEIQSTAAPRVAQDQYDRAEAVVDQVVRFVRLMKRAHARFASHSDGVEHAAYVLLAVLATEGPQRTTALAEAVHSDTSTVSRQVGALVRHGLVERQADPADGRACLLAATPAGLATYENERRTRTRRMADVLSHWSSEDLRTVTELLTRLNTDIETYELINTGAATGAGTTKGGIR